MTKILRNLVDKNELRSKLDTQWRIPVHTQLLSKKHSYFLWKFKIIFHHIHIVSLN